MYTINFTVTKKKFCFSLQYNGANSYLFVNGTEIYKFKAKHSEIVASPLCLGNNSKDWSTDNMKKTDFNGYVYDFSVNYDATDVDDIKVFFVGLTISSGFTNANSLSCISMNNQDCKTRPQAINVNGDEPVFFFHLALKQVNVMVVVIISTIRMQKFVFLML